MSFVNSWVTTHTSLEIYHNLLASGLLNIDHIVQHQIYFQWQKVNKKNWQYHDDQFISSGNLLAEIKD